MTVRPQLPGHSISVDENSLYETHRYIEDLPDASAAPNFQEGVRLLETYSHMPADQVKAHVRAVRDKALAIYPYPCIGRYRFLDLHLPARDEYAAVLERVKQPGALFLDAGCLFGQLLRKLACDGVPPENLVGIELQPDFVELGYDLFRDKDTFAARFVTGDILAAAKAAEAEATATGTAADAEATATDAFSSLDGAVDVMHANFFFHLFGWDDQVRIAKRMIRFFRPGHDVMLIGKQVGHEAPLEPEEHVRVNGEKAYFHSPESLRRLWGEVGEQTGTTWQVHAEIFALDREQGPPRTGILFLITRGAGM